MKNNEMPLKLKGVHYLCKKPNGVGKESMSHECRAISKNLAMGYQNVPVDMCGISSIREA